MKRKAILSLMLAAVLALGAGLGTYAWFSSSATSTESTFTAGTLKLETNGLQSFTLIDLKDRLLQPGDEFDAEPIVIKNAGNLDLAMFKRFTMTDESDVELAKQIEVTKFIVNDWSTGGPVDLAAAGDLTLYNLVNWESEVSFEHWTVLGLREGQAQTIELAFRVNKDAGNDIQGKTLTLSMEVLATQMREGAIYALDEALKLYTGDFAHLSYEIPELYYYGEDGHWN